MFLLSISWEDHEFLVRGASANEYVVRVDSDVSCTCPDFARRGVACKHIYFIVARCAGRLDLAERLADGRPLLSTQDLYADLRRRMSRPTAETADHGRLDECPICRDDFEEPAPTVQCTNRHAFHTACVRAWIGSSSYNAECPYCRVKWDARSAVARTLDEFSFLSQ